MENQKNSYYVSAHPVAGVLLVLAAIVLFVLPCGMKFISIGFFGLSMPEFIAAFGDSEAMWYWVFWGLTLFLWFLSIFLRDRLFMIYGCFVGLVYIAMCVVAFGGVEFITVGSGFICMIAGLFAECIATVILPQKEAPQCNGDAFEEG